MTWATETSIRYLAGSNHDTRIEQNLTDALCGALIRNRPDNLALLQQYTGWQRMAQRLLDQRTTRVLDGLPDEELCVIAQGDVDLNSLARRWNV